MELLSWDWVSRGLASTARVVVELRVVDAEAKRRSLLKQCMEWMLTWAAIIHQIKNRTPWKGERWSHQKWTRPTTMRLEDIKQLMVSLQAPKSYPGLLHHWNPWTRLFLSNSIPLNLETAIPAGWELKLLKPLKILSKSIILRSHKLLISN